MINLRRKYIKMKKAFAITQVDSRKNNERAEIFKFHCREMKDLT